MSITAHPGSRTGTRDERSGDSTPVQGVAGWLATMRRYRDRPLTPYYLLLGATGLLLAIGLVMVLSASSVDSYKHHNGNSY